MRLQEPASPGAPVVLVTGATGYIGGRLVPVLEGAGLLRAIGRRAVEGAADRHRAGAGGSL